jgi:ABC-type multidrug transport system ATPase subunit
MLVRVSLALIETPRLLVVDDFDALRDPADRALVAERLSDLAQQGIRIVLASSDPGDAALLERALPAGAAPALIEL